MNNAIWENTYLEELSGVALKKHIQKIKIIKYLYTNGAKSLADICNRIKISSPTTASIINELVNSGLLEKQGRGKSKGGRKPYLFGLRENSLFVLGVEIGRYRTRLAVFNNKNHNISGLREYNLELNNEIQTINKLCGYIEEIISSSGIDPHKLIGIGINMPGLVDSKNGINYTYFNFNENSVCRILEKKFNRPIFIENDAKAIALAEHRFGLAKGKKDVLVLYLDWGIGLGIIQDGKLYRGVSGFAGEFSHIPIVENGLLCHCGKQGCLETMASGTALVRMMKERIETDKNLLPSIDLTNEPDKDEITLIIDSAKNGNQFAINLLSEIGYNLGKGLAILIQLLNPELIILGGRMTEAEHYITTPIQQSLNIYCMPKLREQSSIVISDMGQDVGMMGAIAVVMENIFENLFKATSK
jgi:N-acetylglucosamine repressor